MKKNADLFKEFLGDEFTINYVKSINLQIKDQLTFISSWCVQLVEADDSKFDYDFRVNIANNIMKYCCQILKNPNICEKMFDAGNSDKLKMITIELNEFLTAFCTKCSKHIENKCKIELEKCENTYIEANEEFLNFIFLMCIRMALSQKSDKVEISFSSDLKYVTICLKINAQKSDDYMFCEVVPDTCNDYFSDIITLLIQKIGGEFYNSDDCMCIKLEKSKGGNFCSKDYFPVVENVFNIFNVMLADFDDYKYY